MTFDDLPYRPYAVILHDTSGGFGRLTPVHEEVFQYPLASDELEMTVAELLEHIFDVLNIGDPDLNLTVGIYRSAGLRSLSVGDAVRVGDTTWLVDRAGWTALADG